MEAKCDACGRFGIMDRCHIRSRGAGAGWETWEFLILCRTHHVESGQVGWFNFCKKFPKILELLNEKGWDFVNQGGVQKLRRK